MLEVCSQPVRLKAGALAVPLAVPLGREPGTARIHRRGIPGALRMCGRAQAASSLGVLS